MSDSERIENLHAVGLKATFVERLRTGAVGSGDTKLAAAHLERLADEVVRLRGAADRVLGELDDADDADIVLEQLHTLPELVRAVRVARAAPTSEEAPR